MKQLGNMAFGILFLSLPVREHGLKLMAWYVVEPLVTLDDAEREYIDRVHAGELSPNLLFPDDEELANRLTRYPVLLWKIENVRRQLSK